MADQLTNGTPTNPDIEMKDDTVVDTTMTSLQDPTDPNPPPQPSTTTDAAPPPPSQAEHLSTIAPSTSTTTTARPTSIPPPTRTALPEKPVPHGGPTRQFLNAHLTPHLLEGMKYVAAYEPEKPLLWLSEFLAGRSREVEG